MLDFLSFRNAELLSLLEPKTIDVLDAELVHQKALRRKTDICVPRANGFNQRLRDFLGPKVYNDLRNAPVFFHNPQVGATTSNGNVECL